MALSVPSIADPRNPAVPVVNAYAWLSSLRLDMATNSGAIVLTVNPSEAAWQAQPIASLSLALGQGGMPTLDQLMADVAFAQAFNAIGSKLYALAATHHPDLAGSTPA